MNVEGRLREFSFFVPGGTQNNALPVVIYFHGHGDSMRHILGKGAFPSPSAFWMEVAEREQFLVFYPLGLKGDDGKTGWNDCRTDATGNPTANDVAFAKVLIEFARKNFNLDRNRIYVTGMSNGGHMAMRMAMEASDQIAAAAAVAALLPKQSGCSPPPHPVPILFMHGTDDPIAPFEGGAMAGKRGVVCSARETVEQWRNWSGLGDARQKTRQLPDRDRSDNSVIIEHSWTRSNGAAVVAYEMKGAGHTEPSRAARLGRLQMMVQGNQNRDIEMAQTIWDFFKEHTLRRQPVSSDAGVKTQRAFSFLFMSSGSSFSHVFSFPEGRQ